jgi:small-conductance mechanosensitive channel
MNFDNVGRALAQLLLDNFPRLIQAALILVVTWLGLLALRGLFKRLYAKAEKNNGFDQPGRMQMLLLASSNTLTALILVTALFSLLALVGINLTPMLASVGVVGLAFSLGAQALIKDYIAGFFIVFENQYSVGDEVLTGSVRGIVEKISLRATWVREFGGRLYTIPNSEVRTVANASRDWMRAIVDLNFSYQEDLQRVIAALSLACERIAEDETIKDDLMETPQVAGWSGFNPWAVQVRLLGKTAPGKQYGVEMALRRYALQALEEAGIQPVTPYAGLTGSSIPG